MHLLARIAVGTLALVPLVSALPAAADTGPVPEEWGEPVVELVMTQVEAIQMGLLPGRLGNQHQIVASTYDEESVATGSVIDWWCPEGAIAPRFAVGETPCRIKAYFDIVDDTTAPASALMQRWSPDLRYVAMRIPIALRNESGIVRRGMVSFRVKATGALERLPWFPEDYQEVLVRRQTQLLGGRFLGTPWSSMHAPNIGYDEVYLLRYYDPV